VFLCPNDGTPLVRNASLSASRSKYWSCPSCGGRTASMGMLRRTARLGVVDALWSAAKNSSAQGSRRCPACERPMSMVPMSMVMSTVAAEIRDDGGNALTVDVCPRCFFVWFDAAEFEAMPPPARRGEAEAKLPLEARLALAKADVEALDMRPNFELPPSDPPPEGWKALPAFFGLPVKHDSRAKAEQPLATWAVATAVAVFGLLAFSNLEQAAQSFGLIPWQPWRYGGMTLLTMFFLHGSAAHLAVNAYFLLAFGDDVEDYLGRSRFLLLLAFATITGGLLHATAYAASSTPLIGAGGSVSALLAFYGLQFPRSRIGFMLRVPHLWFLRWVNVRAWVGVLIWIGLQAIGGLRQTGDLTQVSLYAHLGGAMAGFLFWFFFGPAAIRLPSEQRP
jgi:membrane associated rhomboid family serine protease